MKPVTVIGGGFSGLTTAYYLARDGVPVTLLERDHRLGGLIDTIETPYGLVETAASGIRSSARLESLCRELAVPLVTTKKESRKRYLFRSGRPRQWPLTTTESLEFAGRLATNVVTARFRPADGETVAAWGRRVLGAPATRVILGAALQGVYAGDPSALSANLIFGKQRKRPEKGEKKGLVAPPRGLAELTGALAARLRSLNVDIRTGVESPSVDGTTVICTSARDAGVLLTLRAPEAAREIASIEMVPLLRVTAFYPRSENTVPGFGVLFPRNEGVRALGVLFNTNIFPNRGEGHSESWIYGGAQDREILSYDDAELFDVLAHDRERLYGRHVEALARYPQRWPVGLPHYDTSLESLIRRGIRLPNDVFLGGNYLRGIGLPMLLEQSAAVSAQAARFARDD